MSFFRTIENAHYAFDLIEFPPEIERAVNFATENILVCENIETAKKLSSSEQKFPHTVRNNYKLKYVFLFHFRDNVSKLKIFLQCVSLDGTMFRNDGFISGGASIDKLAKSFNVQNFENLKLQRVIFIFISNFYNIYVEIIFFCENNNYFRNK